CLRSAFLYHRTLHSSPTRRSSDLLVDRVGRGPQAPEHCADRAPGPREQGGLHEELRADVPPGRPQRAPQADLTAALEDRDDHGVDRKSTRLNSSHVKISYAVFCLK